MSASAEVAVKPVRFRLTMDVVMDPGSLTREEAAKAIASNLHYVVDHAQSAGLLVDDSDMTVDCVYYNVDALPDDLPLPEGSFELHGVLMRRVREIGKNLFFGEDEPDGAAPDGVRIYGIPFASVFRKVPEGGPGGFRGRASTHITHKMRECFKVEVWSDDKVRARRLYDSAEAASKALEQLALKIVGDEK